MYKRQPYGPWFENHKLSEKELEGQRRKQWKKQPLISVVVPAYKTPAKFLREMIESLEVQTYTNWELCIALSLIHIYQLFKFPEGSENQ